LFGDEFAKDPERFFYLLFSHAIFRKKTADLGLVANEMKERSRNSRVN
jgi:hypothetical protein